MVQIIDKTTSHIHLFFEDHLAAWRDGVEVSRQTFAVYGEWNWSLSDQLEQPKKWFLVRTWTICLRLLSPLRDQDTSGS